MSESITIVYKPILYSDIIHKKTLNISEEGLAGIIFIVTQILHSNRITIERADGNIIDLTESIHLPNITNDYTCYIDNLKVQFDTLDFIQGAYIICMLMGINCSSLITNSTYKDDKSINFKFEYYIGKVFIKELPFDEPDRDFIVSINILDMYMNPRIANSMSETLRDCFREYNSIGVFNPSVSYIVVSDEQYHNVVGLSSATPVLRVLPPKYANGSLWTKELGHPWYIFNVCARTEHRRKGIAKSSLISVINGLITEGVRSFVLQVDPSNTSAYNLYISLGFIKIDVNINSDTRYDILHLPIYP